MLPWVCLRLRISKSIPLTRSVMHPGLKMQFFKENDYNRRWISETKDIAQRVYSKYATRHLATEEPQPSDANKVI